MNQTEQSTYGLFIAGIMVALFVLTFGLYWQTHRFEFINLDDPGYVYENATFEKGITQTALYECLTKNAVGNWHPLTMMSYAADVWVAQKLGWWKIGQRQDQTNRVAGIFHIHNAFLHACNAVLLFLFLLVLSRWYNKTDNQGQHLCEFSCLFCAALAAAFWAWHPLRAESVAWISSRKDVICMFWYLLGHLIYFKAVLSSKVKHSSLSSYRSKQMGSIVAVAAYFFAFMGKPTAVVYPVTLLLMDYMVTHLEGVWRRVFFYAGLFGLTFVFCVIVLVYQEVAIGNVPAPLFTRTLNMVVAIGAYVRTTLCPVGLSVFYVYGESLPFEHFCVGIFVCFIFIWTLFPWFKQVQSNIQYCIEKQIITSTPQMKKNGRHPLLVFGVLWFLIALIPVIGIVQVGAACRADRYTYLSGIGLSIVVFMFMFECVRHLKHPWQMFSCVGVALLGASLLFYVGDQQIRVWQDDFHLYNHALEWNPENDMAHGNLGVRLMEEDRHDEAFPHICMYGVFKKDYLLVQRVLGSFLRIPKGSRRHVSNEEMLDIVIKDDVPMAMEKHWAYSMIAGMRGCFALAESEIRKALAINSENGYVWHTLATILMATEGQEDAALETYKKSLTLLPKKTYLYPQISIAIHRLEQKTKNAE